MTQSNSTNNPRPDSPDEQTLQPLPDTEVNPSIPGNDTEVDLDKNRTKTYPSPSTNPPERH